MAEVKFNLVGLTAEAMKEVQDDFHRRSGWVVFSAIPYFWSPELEAMPEEGYCWYWPIDGVHTPEVKMSEQGYPIAVVTV